MERGLFCLCPTWSVVLINQNLSINVSLCFASGSEETLFQMHSHYCTLVGDSCRDSGRVLAKRIKDTSTPSMAQYGTFWLILRKCRIQMLESAEEEKNILEKDKQDLTLAGKSSSPFSATVGRNSWACFRHLCSCLWWQHGSQCLWTVEIAEQFLAFEI